MIWNAAWMVFMADDIYGEAAKHRNRFFTVAPWVGAAGDAFPLLRPLTPAIVIVPPDILFQL